MGKMKNVIKSINSKKLRDKFENFIIIAAILLIFFLLFGIAGGLEQGTINFPWEVK